MGRTPVLTTAFVIGSILTGSAGAAECRDDPAVVGQCFMVHARIRLDADLRIHVWPVGTNRLLELSYPPDTQGTPSDFPFMPENLRKLIEPDRAVFGDFEVCRLAPDRPGRLGFICVQSASHLFVQRP